MVNIQDATNNLEGVYNLPPDTATGEGGCQELWGAMVVPVLGSLDTTQGSWAQEIEGKEYHVLEYRMLKIPSVTRTRC